MVSSLHPSMICEGVPRRGCGSYGQSASSGMAEGSRIPRQPLSGRRLMAIRSHRTGLAASSQEASTASRKDIFKYLVLGKSLALSPQCRRCGTWGCVIVYGPPLVLWAKIAPLRMNTQTRSCIHALTVETVHLFICPPLTGRRMRGDDPKIMRGHFF